MKKLKKNKLKIIDILIMSIILAILTYIYIGFYFPDPRMIRRIGGTFQKTVLLGFPLVSFGTIFLFYRIRTGRTPVSAAVLIGTSLIFCGILFYPVASYFYDITFFQNKIDQYHPYLQLSPKKIIISQEEGKNPPLKIMCLGGSTTEYKDKDGYGWPYFVEKRIQSSIPEQNVKVFNMGRQWYTSLHSLINFEVNLRQHKPDIIIVMHAINDLLHNADFSYLSFGPFQEDYRHFHGPVYRLINRETLFDTIWKVVTSMWYHSPRKIVNAEEFPGLIPFERNLRTLIDLAHIDGTKVVLMTQPFLMKENMNEAEKAALHMVNFEAVGPDHKWSIHTAKCGMEKYNDVLRKIAKESTGIMLIDLEPEIPKSLEYLMDDVHYQEKTFDPIGKIVSEELEKIIR